MRAAARDIIAESGPRRAERARESAGCALVSHVVLSVDLASVDHAATRTRQVMFHEFKTVSRFLAQGWHPSCV
jgi:hypothetical protein